MPPKKDLKKEVVAEAPKEELPPPIPPHELEGFGRFEYIDGAVYEGGWKLFEGKKTKSGEGILKIPGTSHSTLGSESYEGSFLHDKFEGYGVYKYANGAIYKGEWKNDLHHGHGEYQFPDGTLYVGQFSNHLMEGTGIYVDSKGRKWEGEFRNGRYEAKMQKELIKERQKAQKKTQIEERIKLLLKSIIEILGKSDKKTFKENFSPFIGHLDTVKEFVKDVAIKMEEKNIEKWIDFFNVLSNENSKVHVLENVQEAQVLDSEKILKNQLEGPGQIVEVISKQGERNVKAAFLNIENDVWVLCFFADDEKKK